MTTNGEPGSRAELVALFIAETVFLRRAVEGGEPERRALAQVAVLRRLSPDPSTRLEAYARLLGLEASRMRADAERIGGATTPAP
jgi:hypothetical protein